VPLFHAGECIGLLEIANRPGGYTEEMIPHLYGLCDSVGVLLSLYSQKSTIAEPRLDFNSTELCSAVVQSISDGIVVTDSGLQVILMNNGALKLFGYSSVKDIQGLDLQAMVDPLLFSHIAEPLQGLAGAGGECTIYNRDAKEIPVRFSVAAFLFSQQRYLCFVFSDIRDKRSYEEKMRFLAFLSHELRTPMQVIVSGLQDLCSKNTHRESSEPLELLVGASNMVTRIVNSVLELSKLESGTVRLNEVNCSISELLESVASIAQTSRSGEVELKIEIDSTVPTEVRIDRVSICVEVLAHS
jgi:PAS domain S-box-containing protein